MDIVKINAKDYGLQTKKAEQIEKMFSPMLNKMKELEIEYNEVVKLDISPDTCSTAKELRLRYVKVRTGTAKIHTELKSFYLAGGRFVDGWKNAQLFASEGIEGKLKAIENHYVIIEQEKINTLQTEREGELAKYVDEETIIPQDLGKMDGDVWSNYLAGTKLNYDKLIEAEKKAESDRIELERVENLFHDRSMELAPYSDFKMIGEVSVATNESDYNKILSDLKDQKSKHDAEQEQIRKDNERLQIEADKASKKLKAKEEAEQKEKEETDRIEAEKKAAEKKAAMAPDKEKLSAWVNTVTIGNIELSSDKAKEIHKNITDKFCDFRGYAEKQINQL